MHDLEANLGSVELSTYGRSFTGLTKCTYIFYTDSSSYDKAPAFSLDNSISNGATWADFSLNYVEYTTADMVSRTDIGATPSYPIADMLPKVTSTVDLSVGESGANYGLNILEQLPGSFQCGQTGMVKKVNAWYDLAPDGAGNCMEVVAERAHYENYVSTYLIALDNFDNQKTDYENRLLEEVDRIGNILTAWFSVPIPVPRRPEAPSQPPAYTGKYLVFDATSHDALRADNDSGLGDNAVGYWDATQADI